MKKTMAILLTITVIAACGIIFVHNWIGNLGDDVTMKETILAGDKKAAEGVVVTTNCHYEETPLFWETTCTVGKENKVETQIAYDRERKDEWIFEDEAMLNLGGQDQLNWYYIGVEGNETPEDNGYPMEAFEDVITETKPGSSHEGTIKMYDWVSYRSVSMNVSFYGDNGYTEVSVDGKDDGSYFRFPMTEYSETKVRVEMSDSGQVTSLSMEPQHHYSLDEKTMITEDLTTVYTAVGDMILVECSAGGMQLDVRSVPLEEGICGVHRFDVSFREDEHGHRFGTVDMKNGQLVYPLEQGTSIEKIWISADESQLLLLTHEEEGIWFTALNSKTYEEEQRMRLYTYDANACDDVIVRDGADYIVAFFDDSNIAFLEKGKKEWSLVGVDKLYRGDGHNYSFWNVVDDENLTLFGVAFDGERFAVVNKKTASAGSYYLWIYEDGKCKYAGEYTSSLAQCSEAAVNDGESGDGPLLRNTYQNALSVRFIDKAN